jgi:predicted nucleic acid-binding protein
MIVFADSSAVVKLYADEAGHEQVSALDAMIVSAIARVEVPAALWRKNRMGELTSQDARTLVRAFEHDLASSTGRLVALPLTNEVLEHAAELTAIHGLRAYDAVQLASARAARRVEPACSTFAAFDGELAEAAAREGFALLS